MSPMKALPAAPEVEHAVLPMIDMRPTTRRLMMLEDRMMQQEMTTRALIDRAIRIKEDLAEYLSTSRHSWDGEKRERQLLHDHIQTITTTVKRLGRDTEGLERDYRDVEERLHSQKQYIRRMEQLIASGNSDLRGRLSRCDAGISRLATELRTCYERTKRVEDEHRQMKQQTDIKLTEMYSSVDKLGSQIQKLTTDVTARLQTLESFVKQQVAILDSRVSTTIEDLRGNITANHRWSEAERGKLSQQLSSRIDLTNSLIDTRMSEFERRVESRLNEMSRQLGDEKQARSAWEARARSRSETAEARCRHVIDQLRKECGESFKAVQESIESMREVLDAKRTLLEQKLEENIQRILKTVVVL